MNFLHIASIGNTSNYNSVVKSKSMYKVLLPLLICTLYLSSAAYAADNAKKSSSKTDVTNIIMSDKKVESKTSGKGSIKKDLAKGLLNLGTGSSGGGDAIIQNGKWKFLDLAESSETEIFVPQLDPYFHIVQTIMDEVIFNKCTGIFYGVLFKFSARFSTENQNTWVDSNMSPDDYKRIFVNFDPLIWYYTNENLENIKDEGQIILRDNESKKQLAVQKNGKVLVYRPIFDQLEDKDKAALFLHEIVLATVLVSNSELHQRNGTAEIRKFIRYIFNHKNVPDYIFDHYCGDRKLLTKYLGYSYYWL